jgi:hypothetical protein
MLPGGIKAWQRRRPKDRRTALEAASRARRDQGRVSKERSHRHRLDGDGAGVAEARDGAMRERIAETAGGGDEPAQGAVHAAGG